jgi:hypothetical protein
MTELRKIPMRMAIRREGAWVVGYLAKGTGMDGAIEMSRIAHFVVENHHDRFDEWKAFLTKIMLDGIEVMTGERPDVIEQPAPESERSGHS